MARKPKPRLLNWLRRFVRSGVALPAEISRAQAVIAAVDAGGTPLNPARINEIARNLGLEVSRKAPVENTIQRLREALERSRQAGPP